MEIIGYLLNHPVLTSASSVTVAAAIAAVYYRIRIALIERKTRMLL